MDDRTQPDRNPEGTPSKESGREGDAAGPAAPIGADASERPTTLPENRRPLDNPRDSTETPSEPEREQR